MISIDDIIASPLTVPLTDDPHILVAVTQTSAPAGWLYADRHGDLLLLATAYRPMSKNIAALALSDGQPKNVEARRAYSHVARRLGLALITQDKNGNPVPRHPLYEEIKTALNTHHDDH